MSLCYSASHGVRALGHLDLWVNGVWVQSAVVKAEQEGRVILNFECSPLSDVLGASKGEDQQGQCEHQQEKIVEVYFPLNVRLNLKSVDVDDAEAIPEDRPSYLALGDSITMGMDALHPSGTYPAQVARFFNHDWINMGIGGHVFDADSLESFDRSFDLITVAYGTNDWTAGLSLQEFESKAKAYLQALKAWQPKARLVLITPVWRKLEVSNGALTLNETSGLSLMDIRRCLSAMAEALGIECVDGLSLLPHREAMFVDGTHPNDLGFAHYAQHLLKALSR